MHPKNHRSVDQQKALKTVDTDETTASVELTIPSLLHRQQVAAPTVLYRMHTSHWPADLRAMLPQRSVTRRVTRTNVSMPFHAQSILITNTNTLNRSFINTAVKVRNKLPEDVDGVIQDFFQRRVHGHCLLP